MKKHFKLVTSIAFVASISTVSVVVTTATPAWAWTTGNGTASCSSVSVSYVKFSPALQSNGTAHHERIHLRVNVSSCTLSGNTNIASLPIGKISTDWIVTGTDANTCSVALPAAGAVPVSIYNKWGGTVTTGNTPPIMGTNFTTSGEDWATGNSPRLTLPVASGEAAGGSFPLLHAPTMEFDLSSVNCSGTIHQLTITGITSPPITF